MQMPLRAGIILAFMLIYASMHTAVAAPLQPAYASKVDSIPPEDRIDINHASAEQLMKVPGITRVWADRILRFRPYRTKLDLKEKGIITDELYDQIQGRIIAHKNKQ